MVSSRTTSLKQNHLRESANGVVSIDTASILVINSHTGIAIADVGDDCVEQQPRIVWL